MFVLKFIVNECGNNADEAWEKAMGSAHYEYNPKSRLNSGIIDKSGFKIIGKISKGINPKEICNKILDNDPDASPSNEKALCLDVGDGEYYFIGKSFREE